MDSILTEAQEGFRSKEVFCSVILLRGMCELGRGQRRHHTWYSRM